MTARCVVLDIGGVLEITPRTGWQRRWEERLQLSPRALRERLRDVWAAGSVGRMNEREVYEQIAGRLGLDTAQTEEFTRDLWEEYLGTANEELIAYVRGLRGRCRLGILSNSLVGARERETARYHFDELVDALVYSHEIGVCKPDPSAYRTVCARLDVHPRDCLFIDDVAASVDAAREVGMQGHLFRDNPRAIDRIDRHLQTAAPTPAPPTAR